MTEPRVCQEFTQRMCAALVFARNEGMDEAAMRSCFDHVLLHVELLNLTEVPPIPTVETVDNPLAKD